MAQDLLLTQTDVLKIMRWSAWTLRRKVQMGVFPQPFYIAGSKRWKKSEIEAMIETASEAAAAESDGL